MNELKSEELADRLTSFIHMMCSSNEALSKLSGSNHPEASSLSSKFHEEFMRCQGKVFDLLVEVLTRMDRLAERVEKLESDKN